MVRLIAALALLGACASSDPFADVIGAQQRLDSRGIGFGVTRVPGVDAFLLQLRFSTSQTEGELSADPMAAALAAAPPGCRVETITTEQDGAAYRVAYDCD